MQTYAISVRVTSVKRNTRRDIAHRRVVEYEQNWSSILVDGIHSVFGLIERGYMILCVKILFVKNRDRFSFLGYVFLWISLMFVCLDLKWLTALLVQHYEGFHPDLVALNRQPTNQRRVNT